MPAMLPFQTPKPPSQAQDLTEIWNRISRQHMSAGAGCGCGFGGLILQASDFELDIVEFVIDEAKHGGRTAIPPFIDAVARRGADRYSLAALLRALGQGQDALGPDDEAFALARIAIPLASMDAAHSKGRFSCD